MQLSGSLIFLTELLVLVTTQEPSTKDGLALFLESAMKEFPQWLNSTVGGSLFHPNTLEHWQYDGFLQLNGEISNLELTGYMEQNATVQADFVGRRAQVKVNFLPSLQIVGNYSLQGWVSNNQISGEGGFKLRNSGDSDSSFVSVAVFGFALIDESRIDPDSFYVQLEEQLFDQSFTEFDGLQSTGFSKHIGRAIKWFLVRPFERLLVNHLETYFRIMLENVSLSSILHDAYDGNLNSSFIDNDMDSYTTDLSDDGFTTPPAY